MNETIKIKYLPGSPRLEQAEWGDWIDLYTYEDVVLKPKEFTIISLGVAMELPQGYEALLLPRSSTFKRWGLLQTNSAGVIDSTFKSNDDIWGMPVYATKPVSIPRGTRLCQFRIIKNQPSIAFEEVSSLNNETRGGFGSTGA